MDFDGGQKTSSVGPLAKLKFFLRWNVLIRAKKKG
jgi:hypothetical protein